MSAVQPTALAGAASSTVKVNWFARATWFGFGLVLPIVCFAFDAQGLLVYGSATSAARVLVVTELILFGIWEWRAVRDGFTASVFAGAFAVGCAFATMTGVFLLPIALPASIVLIGFLGLVPFGTATVYAVLTSRAFERARATRVSLRLGGLAIGVLIATAPFEAIRLYERSVGERAMENFVPNHYESYVHARAVLSILPSCDTSRISDQPGPGPTELNAWCDSTWLDELRDFADF